MMTSLTQQKHTHTETYHSKQYYCTIHYNIHIHIYHISYIIYQISYAIYHMSCIIYHVSNIPTLWQTSTIMENHLFYGKTHFFYGHFPQRQAQHWWCLHCRPMRNVPCAGPQPPSGPCSWQAWLQLGNDEAEICPELCGLLNMVIQCVYIQITVHSTQYIHIYIYIY